MIARLRTLAAAAARQARVASFAPVTLAVANADSRQQGLEPGVMTQWIEIRVDCQIQDFCAPLIDRLLQARQRTV